MILCCTRETKKIFNIPYVDELSEVIKNGAIIIKKEDDIPILKWGLKYFDFDGRDCIQCVNFASKLNIYLFDIHLDEIRYIGDSLARYLLEIYEDDKSMIRCLKKLFKEHPMCVFDKLSDKQTISQLNSNEFYFMNYGETFYDYIENQILKTIEINKDANFNYLVTYKINNKIDYKFPGEVFKKNIMEMYDK